MAIQSIQHRTDLHDTATKIHGTRPTGHALGAYSGQSEFSMMSTKLARW